VVKFKKQKQADFDLLNANSSKPKMSAGEISLKVLVYFLAIVVILVLLMLIVFVIFKSVTIFQVQGFFQFIFVDRWKPGSNEEFLAGTAAFGIGGIIASTLMMLLISMAIAIPITLFASLFISEYLSPRWRNFVINVIKLLAGVPSVVFGLFALNQVGPLFMLMGAFTGTNLLTAAFTLSFMAMPTMISLSYDALQSVPESYRFASLGLGITKEQTTFTVVRKTATPKIISAVIMGMARVIGETMAVILISGNSAAGLETDQGFLGFIFSSIKTLAGTIGLEMLENAGSYHESALYAIGLMLFVVVTIINLTILLLSNFDKYKRRWAFKRATRQGKNHQEINDVMVYNENELNYYVKLKASSRTTQRFMSQIALFLMILSTVIVLGFTVWIFGVVLIKGLIGLQYIDAFISVQGQAGIFAALLTTILLIIATLLFAIPLALATAIFLSEYANKNSIMTKIFRFMINLLASTPSIVFGIFGLSVFIVLFKMPMSILASSLTMAIVVIPLLTSNFEDAISQVPDSYKEAAASLGQTKAQIIFKIVLPNSFERLLTGIILAIAKIIGETAPVYLTLGTAIRMPSEGFLSSGATLTTAIYLLASEGGGEAALSIAFLFSLITMLLVYGLNVLSRSFSSKKNNKINLWTRIQLAWITLISNTWFQWFFNWIAKIKARYLQQQDPVYKEEKRQARIIKKKLKTMIEKKHQQGG